jgi:hypothetical protein
MFSPAQEYSGIYLPLDEYPSTMCPNFEPVDHDELNVNSPPQTPLHGNHIFELLLVISTITDYSGHGIALSPRTLPPVREPFVPDQLPQSIDFNLSPYNQSRTWWNNLPGLYGNLDSAQPQEQTFDQ